MRISTIVFAAGLALGSSIALAQGTGGAGGAAGGAAGGTAGGAAGTKFRTVTVPNLDRAAATAIQSRSRPLSSFEKAALRLRSSNH